MQALKVMIADDEQEARALVKHYLHASGRTVDISECIDGRQALMMLDKEKPDILFLDIRMPEVSGIEVLKKIGTSPLTAVIFTTAYDEYALPAFDLEAVDYLLKPFDRERFERALNKAIAYITSAKNNSRLYLRNLPVKTGIRTDLIPVDEIEYLHADGAYVQVFTITRMHLISDPLYELEKSLDPARFIRVHRSIIVNRNCIRTIQSLLNGDHLLVLNSGKELRASRTYREVVRGLQLGRY